MNSGIHHSVFTKDELFYCVQIDHVREVIRTAEIIKAPGRIHGFLGFLDFRKKLCPVLDIPTLANGEVPQIQGGVLNLIVLEFESCMFALLIDRFVESLQIEAEVLLGGRADSKEPGSHGPTLVSQVMRYKGQALHVVNLGGITSFVESNIDRQLDSQAQELTQGLGAPEEEIEMICFGIDHFKLGIPIADLVEVIEGYSVEPLFRTSSFLRGLINLRGQIIACVDISEAIGLPLRKMEEKNQYILLQDGDRDLALCIDSISKKKKFARSQIQQVEHLFSGELADYLLGVIETGSERIFVISGAKIFMSKYLLEYQE